MHKHCRKLRWPPEMKDLEKLKESKKLISEKRQRFVNTKKTSYPSSSRSNIHWPLNVEKLEN